MSPETYEKAAVLMRYPLAVAGLFIALRALYMTVKDGYRAGKLRQGELRYGAVAMLTVVPADKRGKAQKLPVGRNGCIGSSSRSDVRIKGMGLKSRHFDYEIRSSQMHISPVAAEDLSLLGKRAGEEIRGTLVLSPGDKLLAGKAVISFQMLKLPKSSTSPMNSKVYSAKGKRE